MTQLVCPSCGGSYRKGFTRCSSCDVDLVDEATYKELQRKRDDPRAALAGQKTVAVLHASIAACREIEREFLSAGLPCFVDALTDESELSTAPGALKVGVMIAEADLPRAGDILRKRFAELVAKEGVGSFNTAAVDLEAAEVECPACGHKGALVDGACGDCGLFLGAPE